MCRDPRKDRDKERRNTSWDNIDGWGRNKRIRNMRMRKRRK